MGTSQWSRVVDIVNCSGRTRKPELPTSRRNKQTSASAACALPQLLQENGRRPRRSVGWLITTSRSPGPAREERRTHGRECSSCVAGVSVARSHIPVCTQTVGPSVHNRLTSQDVARCSVCIPFFVTSAHVFLYLYVMCTIAINLYNGYD